MSNRSGQASAVDDLSSAIREFRDVVESKLCNRTIGAKDLESLHRALEELDAGWDGLSAQSEYLAREREYYVELFGLAPEAYVVTDSAGTIREANDAAQGLLRLSSPFLGGKPLQLFVAPEHRSEFRTRLSELLSQDGAAAKSWPGALRRNEGPVPTQFTVSAAPTDDGTVRLCWVLRPHPKRFP